MKIYKHKTIIGWNESITSRETEGVGEKESERIPGLVLNETFFCGRWFAITCFQRDYNMEIYTKQTFQYVLRNCLLRKQFYKVVFTNQFVLLIYIWRKMILHVNNADYSAMNGETSPFAYERSYKYVQTRACEPHKWNSNRQRWVTQWVIGPPWNQLLW